MESGPADTTQGHVYLQYLRVKWLGQRKAERSVGEHLLNMVTKLVVRENALEQHNILMNFGLHVMTGVAVERQLGMHDQKKRLSPQLH